jgi:Transposase IS66 family
LWWRRIFRGYRAIRPGTRCGLQRLGRSRSRRRSGDARLLLEPRPAPLLRDAQGGDARSLRRSSCAAPHSLGSSARSVAMGPSSAAPCAWPQTRPFIDDLRAWLEAKLAKVSGASRIAQAIRYALKHWAGLTVFLDDGPVEIDSNVASARSARSRSIARTRCSPAPTRAASTGASSRRSSRPASSMRSTRRLISPVPSPA